jgi:hypothetical protein
MTERSGSPAPRSLSAIPIPRPSSSPQPLNADGEAHDFPFGPKRGSTARDLLASKDERVANELPEFSVEQALRGRLVQRRLSDTTAVQDTEGRPRPVKFNSYRLVRQDPRWHDGLAKVWEREVSIKVDAEHRRDHLGVHFFICLVWCANASG